MSLGKQLLTVRQFVSRPRYTTLFNYYRKRIAPLILSSAPVRTELRGDWTIRYLTCKDQMLETIWSAKSLLRHVSAPLYIHEDGSFDRKCFQTLHEHFPDAIIVTRQESDEKTIPLLSEKSRHMRQRLVLFMKLFDFQAWANEPYLMMDTDVLLFRRPDELLALGTARFNCGDLDDVSHLAWERSYIEMKTGVRLEAGFNSGLLYFPHRIKFERVEHWLDVLGEPSFLWAAEQTILNLEAQLMGMEALGPQYDIFERNWPDVISEHYLSTSRLNMYRRGYPILQSRLP